MKKNVLIKITSMFLVILLIIPQMILNVSAVEGSRPQTRGVAASILSGATLTSNTNSPVNVNDKYNFTLKITGTALAEIGMDDKKTAVFAVPPELQGKVTPKSKIIVDATFLPFSLKDITAIASPLAAVSSAVDALVAMGAKFSVDLKFIKTAYNTMINEKISSYHAEITATASADGRMIYANFNDDLNTHVVNSLQKLITTFSEVLKLVPSDVAFQAPLTALTSAINTLKTGLTVATIGPSLNANFLSTTTASLAVEVANPTTSSSIFRGDILSNSSIDVSLFDGLGGAATIIFNAAWNSYTVPTPTVNPVTEDSTQVTGTIDTTTAPAGTTFEAKITIGSNPEQTVTVAADGSFSYPVTETLSVGDNVSVVVTATNSGNTKTATGTVTITAGDPWNSYTVPTPTVNPVTEDSTQVTGTIDTTTAPAGTTFEAKITIGSNPEQTVTVAADGSFSYPVTETLSVGDNVSVVVTATNSGNTKTATGTVTITAGDPWNSYTVPTPTVNPVTEDSTQVTGTIDTTTAPAGTTFEAKITIGSNPEQTVTVAADGSFSYPVTETLSVGDNVSVVVTATNSGNTKTATGTVTITAGDPWNSYTVPTPTVNPVTEDSTQVTGTIDTTSAPAGTTFEAKITIGSNPEQTVTVAADGSFSYPVTETLSVGDNVSVVVTATNSGNTKTATGTVTITAGDPWNSYTVPTPTVNPVTEDSTQVTGTIDTTTAPAGTTFEAKITIGSNPEQTVTVAADGSFSYPVTETLSVGDNVSVVVTATNSGNTKTATGTVTITAGDPWNSYTVPTPTVNPVTEDSTQVTGTIDTTTAPAGTTFEAKITIGSNPEQTVTVAADGSFSYPVTETLSVGDNVSVVVTATNSGNTKTATGTVTITAGDPWNSYTVPTPTVNPVTEDSTQVTGTIDTTSAPAGTTFEAKITIGSNPEQTVTVAADGSFSYPVTETLSVGDNVSVVVTATNSGNTKTATGTVTITAGDPWNSYTVPTPTVNPVTEDSTQVTGTIDTTTAPAGTTFEAKITIGSNPEQTVTVAADGSFSYPVTETLVAGDTVSVVVTATNSGNTKTATGTVTITAGDPWNSYTVPTPTVNPVTEDSTQVTGTIDTTTAPAGTTFEAKITIGSNPEQTVTVAADGSFSYPVTETLSVGDNVSVVVTATNSGNTKTATGTVTITAGDPWNSYTVPTPTVNPVTEDSTQVTGTIDTTSAPAGTTFEAKITIGSNPEQTVTVAADGSFSYPVTETLVAGDTVSVVVTATNSGNTKTATGTVTITAGDPWNSYTVPTPTVNPVTEDSTQVTGTIDTTSAPAGTTFEAKITIGSNPEQTVTVAADGSFSYPVTETLSVGDNVSVVVTATNSGNTKTATGTVTITAGDPWNSYTVPTPAVNPVTEDSTQITGAIDTTSAPAGTTFEAKITIGSNPEQTVTVAADGSFSYPVTETLSVGDNVSVVVTATNSGNTKTATGTVTITAGDPWNSYTVPTPTVNPVTEDSTQVTGTIDTTTAPAGTTFEAKITIGSNPEQTVTVAADGSFSYPVTETLVAGDTVSVVVTATNSGNTKTATGTVTITAGDPWNSYTVPTPTVNPVTEDSTQVTGTIDTTTAPAGTTFEAKITIGSNPEQTVTVAADGSFSYPVTETLVAGDTVSVVVTATNSGNTKTATGTVTITAGDPWNSYTVPTPTVNPVTEDSTQVTGAIDTTSAPAGTTFEAKITIGSNPEQTVTVAADGSFSYPVTETLVAGDTVSVVVTATNSGNTKTATGTVTITAGDPWNSYTVPTPTISPVTEDSTQVTGTIDTTTAPAGTTFEAKITIGSNPEQTVTVAADGSFSYPVTETLSVGDNVSVVVTATNSGNTKTATGTVTITAGDPWNSYTVPTPTVNPVTEDSTQVTGTIDTTTAPAGTTFEAKITIGSNPEQTVTVAADGSFSYPVTETLVAGDTVSVVVTATNSGNTKTATGTVTITAGDPWNSYTVPTPTVNPVTEDSTQVTGTIDTTTAPAGTTFEAKITIGSNPEQTVTVAADGSFSYPVTETLSVGDNVSVVVTATNSGNTKTATGTVTIGAGGSVDLGRSGGSGGSRSSRVGTNKADISRNFASLSSSRANIYWGCLSGKSNPLTLKQARELFDISLQKMPINTTSLVLRTYNKTSVDLSVLNSLKEMADKNGVCVTIYFDYVVDKSIVSRIQVNPATTSKSINLCLVARKNKLAKANYLIKTYDDNVFRLDFAQKINFGVDTTVTIKLPQSYKSDDIDFYQLNPATGIYTKITPVYSIDSKRYLTFSINTTEYIYICGN